jgi:cell division protein FtsZ
MNSEDMMSVSETERPLAVSTPGDAEPGAAAEPVSLPLPAASSPVPRPEVRVLGVGDAGANVLDALIRAGFSAEACAVLNSHAESLSRGLAADKVFTDAKQGRGIGCCGDAGKGRTGAEARESEIHALCKGARAVILVCGLGGGAGTGGAPVAARIAREAGAITLVLAALPLKREGLLRQRTAESGLADLRKQADLVFPFENERAIAPDASLLSTYNQPNEALALSVRSLFHALSAGSVLGLPFSDICMLMRDRAGDCALATAESSGADRAGTIGSKLLAHPCLENGAATLAEAEAVAVCVVGGASLAIAEVNKVVDFTSRESSSTPFLMGASIQPLMQDTISVLLLIGRAREAMPENRSAPEETQSAWQNDVSASDPAGRPKSRMVPPPPEISQERARQLAGQTPRGRKGSSRLRQSQLPLDIVSRGRFDKSEPTIHKGEDLDIPTYVRRGVPLN